MVLIECRRIALAAALALVSMPAGAVAITITANTNWSAIATGSGAGGQPDNNDTILVKAGRTLTVNVTNALVGALTLGGGNPSGGQGTLAFSAATSQLTISSAGAGTGLLTLGSGGQTGNLNMANGGTLTLAGFVSSSVGTFTRSATVTNGTVVLTDVNTLPAAAAYATYNNLSISAGTTTLGRNTTVAGNLNVSTGATLSTSTRTLAVNGTANVDGTLTLTNTTTVLGATTVGGTISITSSTGTKTFDDITIDPGGTFNAAIVPAIITFTGNVTNNGTFNPGNGPYTFAGNTAQAFSNVAGATTMTSVVINNTTVGGGLTLTGTNNLTTPSMTLTNGKITTGANVVYISNGSTITGAAAGRFIEGNLKKPFSAGSLTRTFEVGGNGVIGPSNYSPVSISFAAISVAGDITVSSTAGSHPQLALSGLDVTTPAKLNRWYRITNGGVAYTTYSATFNFAAADSDAGADETAFRVMRWDGAAWDITNVTSAAATATAIGTETDLGDFAIGEPDGYRGSAGSNSRFNAFDTTAPAGVLQGTIGTKIAASNAAGSFTLRIIHLTTAGTALQGTATFNGRVELLDASPSGGTFTNNCSSAWTTVIYDSGVVTNLFAAANTINFTFNPAAATPTNQLNDAWPNVRVRVTRTSGGTEVGCSGDRFAIRPNDFLVEGRDADWQSAGTTRPLSNVASPGGNVHAASVSTAATPRPFTIRITARNSGALAATDNYNKSTAAQPPVGVVQSALSAVLGTDLGTLTLGAWTNPNTPANSAGIFTASAHYDEVGAFNLTLQDTSFAAVDTADTTLANRRIQGSANIGRFVPDRFTFVTPNSPVLQTFGSSCTGRSFTYVGQPFWYASAAAPSATLNAVNANGTITKNYESTLFKLTAASITETYSNNSVGPTLFCRPTSNLTLTCSPTNGPAPTLPVGVDGASTYTASASGGVLIYDRVTTGTPPSPFNANISLTVVATDTSENAVVGNPGNGATPALTTSPSLAFNAIAFDGGNFDTPGGFINGKTFVYGRLRLVNAYGSHLVPLPVGIETQYWNGSAFQLNSQDNCTTLAQSNITLGTYRPNLDPCETAVSAGSATVSQGAGRLYLAAPGAAALTGAAGTPIAGSVQLTANLGVTPSGNYCPSVGAAQSAATAADKAYLQGAWTGATFTEDPTARGTFGFYGAQPRNFIYFRENY